jgi:hypothetical protein
MHHKSLIDGIPGLLEVVVGDSNSFLLDHAVGYDLQPTHFIS